MTLNALVNLLCLSSHPALPSEPNYQRFVSPISGEFDPSGQEAIKFGRFYFSNPLNEFFFEKEEVKMHKSERNQEVHLKRVDRTMKYI